MEACVGVEGASQVWVGAGLGRVPGPGLLPGQGTCLGQGTGLDLVLSCRFDREEA